MSKKELLDKAFQEGLTFVNANGASSDVAANIIETAMKAFAERENVSFTDEEIKATIIAGLETIKKVGKDFSYQSKMML